MRSLTASVAFVIASGGLVPARADEAHARTKDRVLGSVDRLRGELVGLSDRVWS